MVIQGLSPTLVQNLRNKKITSPPYISDADYSQGGTRSAAVEDSKPSNQLNDKEQVALLSKEIS